MEYHGDELQTKLVYDVKILFRGFANSKGDTFVTRFLKNVI